MQSSNVIVRTLLSRITKNKGTKSLVCYLTYSNEILVMEQSEKKMKNFTKSALTTGFTALALSSTLLLSGCGGASNEQTHAIAGSVIGGIIGHQLGGKGDGKNIMTAIGVAVGGMIGGNIGSGLDQRDQQKINRSLESTPNYQKVAWDNQNTNTQYEFTPINKYEGNVNGNRTQCRDYVMDAWIDGRMQQINGRACKNSRGQWINAS